MSEVDAIRLTAEDNVATVLRAIAVGEVIRIREEGMVTLLTAEEAVPMCHKICVEPIAPDQAVVKYGQRIGQATTAIAAGRHVHVHNLRSARARPR